MDNWGSWTFSEQNENLLVEVLKKFSSQVPSPSTHRKDLFSSLASAASATFENPFELSNSSSCSSDDEDDSNRIDKDFNAIEQFVPKTTVVAEVSVETDDTSDVSMQEIPEVENSVPNDESFLLDQTIVHDNLKNSTKLIVEMLATDKCDAKKLADLIKLEKTRRNDVSDLIAEILPDIVTDIGRHRFCEAIVKINEHPQVVFDQIYTPWLKTCKTNLTGFIDSLSKLIVHFPEFACKSFLVGLLKDKDSVMVTHLHWLVEVMKSLDQNYWCTLLSEYMKHCDSMDQYKIPVLALLVKNCKKSLSSSDAERLVALCRNAAYDQSNNRHFASFIVSVIGAIDLNKFSPEMTAISQQLKGASKFMVMKALRDAK
ncbi:uncharacterized protein LOC126843110 isoform X3 [Adelges cooleyi]|uniref:uncharacterized protein LOC126843110 isoform X3 n=1 Tax=Adelges cooleyi TaxID=133065 RepID=UPI00218045DC|nr:uncharacterized protein LOC126843110 isoform X3 [Adelges cooleyi]